VFHEPHCDVAFPPAYGGPLAHNRRVALDFDQCVRAALSRDARFDGQFFVTVLTTGIYCRPSCPVAPPKPANMRFVATAAAAQAGGFRACKRCRPDAAPGSPEWDLRGDVVGRAVRLIGDGVVDRCGVGGLAQQVGYSTRQLERLMIAEVGAGPLAMARAQRAQTARVLIDATALPMADVAFAAGFGSVRQFNDTIGATFALTPSELRARAAVGQRASTGSIDTRLAFRAPLWAEGLFAHLVATAIPQVEEWRDGAYRRTLRLPRGVGIVALTPHADHVACRLWLTDLRDIPTAIARCRRLLDLDADPWAVDHTLGRDPLLAPLVHQTPGRRVPRTVDEHEMAIRAVLGQQISTAAARTHTARLVAALGEPIDDPGGGLSRLFPTAAAIAQVGPDVLRMPAQRRATVSSLAAALADGKIDLHPGADRDTARAALHAVAGIGPWSVETIAMRALGDPDAFMPSDLGVRAALQGLGIAVSGAALAERTRSWRPWRSYATQYLWGMSSHAINRLPSVTTAADRDGKVA
jgi:AraC family transcriptional regulator of adaptative response / DNA-3-methyladenine glycosylase II